MPKLKYFFLFLAGIIAFSRIAVGAHFFTDIIGGLIIASISFKIVLFLSNNRFPMLKLKTILKLKKNSPQYLFANFALILILITVGPSFDLFFSAVFYKGNGEFMLQSYYPFVVLVREILLPAVLIYILFIPVFSRFFLPINKMYFKYVFTSKQLIFIWSAVLLNTLVIALLKNLWGRARPGDIKELGGEENFSTWYEITNACSTNCSFVSGDAAVGFSIIILYFVTKNTKYLLVSLFFGLLFGVVRISEGGHFLSDVVFSALIVFLLTFFLKKFFIRLYDN